LLVLLFYYSGIIGILAMMKPYMVDLGYNVKEIGFMSGIVGTSVASVCALVAGFIIKRLGRKASIYLFAVLNILAAGYFFLISMDTPTVVQLYLAISFVWGAYGLSSVIIYTTSMDAVRKNSEGTDFTVQIVITHLSSMLVAIFSGRIGDSIGYNGLFGVEVLMGLASLVVLFYNYPVKLKLWK
jgi:predicted MFS family arabinose efflux permease